MSSPSRKAVAAAKMMAHVSGLVDKMMFREGNAFGLPSNLNKDGCYPDGTKFKVGGEFYDRKLAKQEFVRGLMA